MTSERAAGGPDGDTVPRCLPTLVVQSVVFRPDRASLHRFAAGLASAVTRAHRAGVLGEVTLAVADNTPPGLGQIDTDALRDAFAAVDAARVTRQAVLGCPDNPGHGAGHNALAQSTSSDLLLLVNPDTVATPTLLVELLAGLDAPAWAPGQVGMVEARQLPLELPKVFDPVTGETPWASAACLLVCRALFEHLGGFDSEHFFLHCDDVDLSWRARLAGARIVHRPAAVIFHDKRLTETGHLEVGDVEHRYSAEGALILAHRYDHRPLQDQLLATYRAGNPAQRAAVEAFEARRLAGQLPEVLDSEHQVARLGPGSWSALRFGLEPAGAL